MTWVKIEFTEMWEDREILDFVAAFTGATFFHTPAWLEALESSFKRFRAGWITARESGELVGLMPMVEMLKGPFRSFWSLPFGTYGHPLARDHAVINALLETFVRFAYTPFCLEAVGTFFDGSCLTAIAPPASVRMAECCLIELEGTFDDYWRQALSSKRRQLCNKGLRAGVVVRPLESEGEVRAFHTLYAASSRKWGGVHPYPLRFFLELFRRREAGIVFWGGFLRGELLGGNINFYSGQMAQAWQAGLSIDAYSYYIGSLLVTSAVEDAYRRGLKTFNLGSSGGDEGLIFFKKSLGGTEFAYPVVDVHKRWWKWLRNR